MPRFITDNDVKVIHAPWWEDGETVTIKKLTYGDRQRVGKAAIRLKVNAKGDLGDTELGDVNLTLLEIGVVSWTFTRPDNGKPLPVSRAWLEKLSEEDGDFILSEINAFNPTPKRSDAEQEEFRGADRDGGEERDSASG